MDLVFWIEAQCAGYFSHCCDKPDKQLEEGRVIVPYGSNGHHVSHRSGTVAGAEGVGHIASSQEESNEYLLSAPFLFFNQPRTPAHGIVPPTVRVGLPTSLNLV